MPIVQVLCTSAMKKSKISFFNTEKMLSLFSHLKLNSENVFLRRSSRCRSLKVVIKNLLTRVFFSVATIRGADWGLLCKLRFRPIWEMSLMQSAYTFIEKINLSSALQLYNWVQQMRFTRVGGWNPKMWMNGKNTFYVFQYSIFNSR